MPPEQLYGSSLFRDSSVSFSFYCPMLSESFTSRSTLAQVGNLYCCIYPYQCAATTTGLKGRGPRANLLKYIWRTATPSPHRCLINSGTNYSTNLLLTIARLRRALRSCRSHDSPAGSFVRPHRVLLCSRCSNPRSSRIFMTYGTGASLMNNNLTTKGLAETQQLMCILLPCVSAIRQINSVAASTWVNSKVTTVVVFGLDSHSASAILP